MRVFIGFIEVSGRNNALKRGFDALGIPCTFISYFHHRFKYQASSTRCFVQKIFDRLAIVEGRVSRQSYGVRIIWAIFHQSLRIPLFLWAICTHDVFIFSFNTSFFMRFDLPLLRLLGKQIIYQFHGSDSRPCYIGWGVMPRENETNGQSPVFSDKEVHQCIKKTKYKKKIIKSIDKYANAIIDIPPQGYFHERPYVNRLMVGLPSGPYNLPQERTSVNQSVRILHAPSNIAAKGTLIIRSLVDKMKQKGYEIEYVEVVNQPHEAVLKELAKCDIVFDQMHTDYGAPGFATEACWYGKPVLNSGHSVDLWKEILPKEKQPPILYVELDKVEFTLEKLIQDKSYREAIGKKSREFVMKYWQPKQVADNYLKVIMNEIHNEWWVNPSKIKKVYGGFFSTKKEAQEMTLKTIELGGIEALQLSDKPAVEEIFVKFAHGN